MLEKLFIWTLQALHEFWSVFLNSAFGAAMIAGGLAAYFGARGAQRSAARDERRKRLRDEIIYTNACISVTFSIVNTLLGLKHQHTAHMKLDYDALRANFLEHKRRVDAGEVFPEPFAIPADFETLEEIDFPVARLETLAFEKLLLPARPLTVVPMVARALVSLNRTITERNALIEEYRKSGPHGIEELINFYFGVRDRRGHTDIRYGSHIEHLSRKTDDCIFFTKFLNDDLVAHGEVQRARYYKVFGKFAPKIHKPLFDVPRAAGLFPDAEQYADWTSMFITRPVRHRLSRRTRLRRRLWDRPRTRISRLCSRMRG